MTAAALFRAVTRVQAVYYVVTGAWPLVHMRSFEALTGPKRDDWLVHTVGAQLAVAGAALWLGGDRGSMPMAVLSIGSAASLAAVDVANVAARRISPVYLLDAAAEVALIAGAAAAIIGERRAGEPRAE